MALADLFRTREPEPTGYEEHGKPNPHLTGQLGEDEAALAALNRQHDASELAPIHPQHEAPPPIVIAQELAPDEWIGETFIVKPGEVVQILGRDDQREAADITNQTNLENNSGNGTAVFLFRTKADATNFINATEQPQQGRFVVLPDGAGREIRHTAAVYAAVRPNAAGNAIVDCAVERYSRGRRR